MRGAAGTAMLALVFGAAMTLSFAPADAWWFTPWCLAGLFMLADGAGWRRGFGAGFAFGLGWFGAGLWWMAAGLERFTQAGLPLSLALTAGLCAYLALFPACAMALACKLAQCSPGRMRAAPGVFALAALLTVMEAARATLFGGMPMLAPGYAHAAGPLAGFAPLVGALGLTFLNAALAAALARCLPQLGTSEGRRRWRLLPLAVLALCLCGQALDRVAWTRDTGRVLSVRLLQGNLPQNDKFSVHGLRRAVDTYLGLIGNGNAGLTVLPETALPIEWESSPPGLVAAWRRLAREGNTALLIGAMARAPARAGASADGTNSALVMLPDSMRETYDYRYDKVHLVPMVEQVPAGAAWIWRRVRAEFGSLSPGSAGQAPLRLPQGAVAIGICYESLFDTATARKAQGANLIVNISNYAWFQGSHASDQHLQAARLRARETGRWFLQSGNGGLTAAIDPGGRVRALLPRDATAVLEADVRMHEGVTPFMQLGNWPLLLACAVLLAWLVRPLIILSIPYLETQ